MAENIIYCFSGTGNCLDIAKNIARELGDTDIVMMRRAPSVTDATGAKRVGFVFPCYGGGLPGGVEESLKSIQVSADAYKFAVCSCAAYPGTGLATVDTLFGLDYWEVLSHQCSCIWLFPHTLMLPPLERDAILFRPAARTVRTGLSVEIAALLSW